MSAGVLLVDSSSAIVVSYNQYDVVKDQVRKVIGQ